MVRNDRTSVRLTLGVKYLIAAWRHIEADATHTIDAELVDPVEQLHLLIIEVNLTGIVAGHYHTTNEKQPLSYCDDHKQKLQMACETAGDRSYSVSADNAWFYQPSYLILEDVYWAVF